MATKTKFTVAADGELVIETDAGENSDGSPALTRRAVRPEQIAAHRRDPEFERALQRSNLSAAQKAALPAPKKK